MCSVVGYIGNKPCRAIVFEGLKRLEYRGYDSAGFACLDACNDIQCIKAVGKLENLRKEIDKNPLDGTRGIGHTRWATHGGVSIANAHPHSDCAKKIYVVHNGIIENHDQLRKKLEAAGHTFTSTTDTEVIAHLFEANFSHSTSLKDVAQQVMNSLEGTYAFIAMLKDYPDTIVLARNRSPLCIGLGNSEFFLASDPLAFAGYADSVVYLPDESFALVSHRGINLFDNSGNELEFFPTKLDLAWQDTQCMHDHYMLKEIYEQKTVIHDTVQYLQQIHDTIWQHMGLTPEYARNLESINMIGCGTSWHAGYIGTFFIEQITKIPAYVHLASEFRYKPFFSPQNSVYIAISQSGETADTLEAMSLVQSHKIPVVALSNVASSTACRQADGSLLIKAGYEIAVVSTKAFTAQVVALYWLAHRLALEKGIINPQQMKSACDDLLVTSQILEDCIERYKREIIRTLAPKYAEHKNFIFLGRYDSYPFAMEAALKLKETAYLYAISYSAGELKHGPLALIEKDTPVFVFSTQDPIVYQKLLGNVQEVKARGARVTAFAFQDQKELQNLADYVFVIPKVALLLGSVAMTGLMQFLVYYIAKELGREIDKPRNLAKSVTVE